MTIVILNGKKSAIRSGLGFKYSNNGWLRDKLLGFHKIAIYIFAKRYFNLAYIKFT